MSIVLSYSDLSSNYYTTMNKDSFRGLSHLIDLDLSSNYLNFLPNNLFNDLDSLTKL